MPGLVLQQLGVAAVFDDPASVQPAQGG